MNVVKINDKIMGVCPYCQEKVSARVIKKHILRRDKCECPLCLKIIYVCRYPGCHNYASGGCVYDDELCPTCAKDIANSSGFIIKNTVKVATAAVAVVVATAFAKDKMK
ncbi:hypothetical protein [Orbus mooreae]|uniref:hypothetical protein n=1 Tax=Orbus mooreae TaxID=3074107 RepID=UPI00370D8BE9